MRPTRSSGRPTGRSPSSSSAPALDGDDVSFQVGPLSAGNGVGALVGDGAGIRYIAFCYDAEPDAVAVAVPAAAVAPAPRRGTGHGRRRRLATTRRAILGDRPSILGRMLRAGSAA